MCTASIMEGLSPKGDNEELRVGRNQARLSRDGGFVLEGLMSDKAKRRAKLDMGAAAAENLTVGTRQANR
ncbi:MAG: hypothetical protein ACXABN_19460 [Candidatus Thorarchaeota archaeon]|jgi:hypothetical protein